MAIEANDLVREARKNSSIAIFSRIRYLGRFASEDELVEFYNGLLVKAIEGKYEGRWSELERYLEEWESRLMQRYAQGLQFPDAAAIPWTPLVKPLSRSRVALVTSGGIHLDDQPPYTGANDASYRVIPKGTPQERIRVTHPGYDVSGPQRDVNCVFPLHRFEELEREGVIGELAEVNYSFMGLIRDLTVLGDNPLAVAEKLKAAQVDAVFFTST
ncbi:MAG: hypothetical protein HYY31_06035 [Chloroflexi bacterium]|nr:hypothetical protein [Chloroflexota bacterium]